MNNMKLTFAAKSENESFARSVVAAFFAQLNPTVQEIEDIKTAVSEAVTNCIVHGYCGRQEGDVTIECVLDEGEMTAIITDFGKGIPDVAKAMEPFFTTQKNGERSGMGFTIMGSFMDKLRVRSTPGKGTTVTMQRCIRTRVSAR